MTRPLAVLCVGLACALAVDAQPPSSTQSSVTAFVGARLIDGTGRSPVSNGVIVTRNGRIEAAGAATSVRIPSGATQIDLAGKTVVPGFINTHGHVGETRGLSSSAENYTEENLLRQLRLYARYGVTTVFSLGGDREAGVRLRDAQSTPTLDRARLYVAGPALAPRTVDEVPKLIADLKALKADIVKIRVDDNLGATTKLPASIYQAVIDEAHRQGLRVAAHLFYLDDAKSLARAGVDYLAHSVRDMPVDEELIGLLKEKGICVCPTLTREVSTFVYETTPGFFSDPFFTKYGDVETVRQLKEPKRQEAMRTSKSAQRYKVALEMAMKNLKRLADAGVRIAFGTDTGPPARFQGYFEHMEMQLMAEAGLTPKQILASATGDAARCTGLSERVGTLEPGKWADFVALEGDPLADIRDARTIHGVWIAGNRAEP